MTDEKKYIQLEEALLKKAQGYIGEDESEEFVYDTEGNARLAKRKITRYQVAPDLAAIKMLYDERRREMGEELSEEELIAERDRLLKLLFEKNKK
ncbi:MAG: hypothetical protein FWC82_00075 [Firmicutes bacterium]|nr:hypothetical protein [Bacillota bacterium]